MSEIAIIPERNEITSWQHPPLVLLAQQFIDSLDCRENSIKTYTRQLKEFLEWINYADKPLDLSTWTRQDILDYKRYLQSTIRMKTANGEVKALAPNTISGYLMIVRKLWSWLEQEGICQNIAKNIKGIRRADGFKKHTLTIGQIKDALEVFNCSMLEGLRDYSMFNLMVRTGCRDIEISRILIKHLGTLNGHQVLYIQAKGHDSPDQYKVLTEDSERPIRAYLDARKKMQPYSDDDYLFVSMSRRNKGQGLTTRSISRIIKNALRKIGLDDEKLTAHSLRHTAITLAISGGATLHQAQAMAGHKDPRTTMTYFHNQKRLEEAAEKCITF